MLKGQNYLLDLRAYEAEKDVFNWHVWTAIFFAAAALGLIAHLNWITIGYESKPLKWSIQTTNVHGFDFIGRVINFKIMSELTDDEGNNLIEGDKVYVYVKGHYGTICDIKDGKIVPTPIMKNAPSFMRPTFRKITK